MIKLLTVIAATGILQLVAAGLILPGAYAAQLTLRTVAPFDEVAGILLSLAVVIGYTWLVVWLSIKLYRRNRGLH